MSRIEEQAAATKQEVGGGGAGDPAVGVNHHVVVLVAAGSSVVDMATQQGQILTWREAKLKNQVVTPPPLEERLSKVNYIQFNSIRINSI